VEIEVEDGRGLRSPSQQGRQWLKSGNQGNRSWSIHAGAQNPVGAGDRAALGIFRLACLARGRRPKPELISITERIVQDVALMERLRAAIGSNNKERARAVMSEVTQSAREIDPSINVSEGVGIIVILVEIIRTQPSNAHPPRTVLGAVTLEERISGFLRHSAFEKRLFCGIIEVLMGIAGENRKCLAPVRWRRAHQPVTGLPQTILAPKGRWRNSD
jgi:hypothetical protein